ncbi:MAG: hypothetical protein ACYTEQ_09850 [Planctomycetota bacterium]
MSGIFHISGFRSLRENHHFESWPLVELNRRLLSSPDQAVYKDFEQFFQRLDKRNDGKWCIKDPVLSLTIHDLYPLVPKPVKILLNFRHPGNTIAHLMRPREKLFPKMMGVEVQRDAEKEWCERNTSALDFLELHPDISYMMINYDDLVDRKLDGALNRFVGQRLNYEFIRPRKRRSPRIAVSDEVLELYEDLLELYRVNLSQIGLNETQPARPRLIRTFDRLRCIKYLYVDFHPRRLFRRLGDVVGSQNEI